MDQANLPDGPAQIGLATDPQTASPLPAPIPPSMMRRIFIGPSGLRSGWSLVLYLIMAAALGLGLSFLLRWVLPKRPPFIWGFLIGEVLSLTATIVPAIIMAKIEKRPFGVYGLPRRGVFGKLFWVGMLWGIVSLSVLMLAMRAARVFYFGNLALHGTRLLEYACFWIGFFVIVGLFEEFFLRGYTQFTLARGIGFWPSAILFSTLFGASHLSNKGEDIVGALGAASIGLFFCLTLRRTGNLWFAVGMHASWDWGETYLFSVPNSGIVMPGHLINSTIQGPRWLAGGTVGPEASVLVFVVIALMWLVFHWTYREAKYQAS